MGIFNQKTKFKVAAPTLQKVKVTVDVAKPRLKPQDSRPKLSNSPHLSARSNSSARSSSTPSLSPAVASPAAARQASFSPYPRLSSERHSSDSRNGDRKRKVASKAASQRRSPIHDRVEFDKDSDSDDDWEATLTARGSKRTRLETARTDPDRRLAHAALLETRGLKKAQGDGLATEDTKQAKASAPRSDTKPLDIIHAADVASRSLKCVPVLGATAAEVLVELQYPGSRHRERYELVWGKDKIDAVKDIMATIRHTAEVYLTDEQAQPIFDPVSGILRQLERASSDKVKDIKMFRAALDDFNSRLQALHDDGTIAENLDKQHVLPSQLTAFVLDQVYDRTVAPKVELLRKYENGSDNVYGELLHPFITNILVERLQMKCGQVFVDLGSGVGNVVLQAALEIGCESWGCEMMENACNLAEAQKKEFTERCRLWGIAPGQVHLERGDFRTNTAVQDVLKRADVVLVNNQAFTSQLNDDLVRMFLDFKTGCKIVSLKSFVHDHKSASHNINDVGNTILDVEQLTYPEGYVSWTGAAGVFCISTRK